jgi:putative endopeptidase
MKELLWGLACASPVAGYGGSTEAPLLPATSITGLSSGIATQFIDESVRAQDDFYRHVNGKWLANTEIPPDKGRYGAFEQLTDDAQDQLRGIVEGLLTAVDATDPDQRKIADLYASFMDEAALERLGLKPLDAEFARIDAVTNPAQIPSLIAHFNRIGVAAPYTPRVHQDARDSSKYVFDLAQDGIGMPDRDFYLQHDTRLTQVREQYQKHVEKMLALADDSNAANDSKDILALETALATLQWTKVANRDPIKTYNKVEIRALGNLTPGYNWKAYLADSGVARKIDYLLIRQPSYITGFNELLQRTPLTVWKAYFRWRLLSRAAPYLSKRFVDEHFAFYGTVLRGMERDEARWKRGVGLVNRSIGEALGRLYVAKYFPPESKARIDRLVKNLLAAYEADIATLDWMGPTTRQKAQDKLAKFSTKIGYPVKWRDYSALRIVRGKLFANVIRANQFEYRRNLDKLGRPIDHTEWHMTPQTVNAYYDPEGNEIVFPAAILQPPFFNAEADDAANYGGIGAVIGHEISHGFDDQGSQYDGEGNLLSPPGWFTQADLEQFKIRTHALVEQYSAYAPVPGYPINGELTLGENIADNSGLAIAYKAYQLSLSDQPAPVIDGLTGAQRFYMGWAQVWRAKTRDEEAISRIKSDPHSPAQFRGTVPEMNHTPFYESFGVKPGDKMYLPPAQRVALW